MTPIIRADKIADYIDQEVMLQGWVYNRTDKGKLVFLLVRDGYGFVQCVAFKGDLEADLFDRLARLPQRIISNYYRGGESRFAGPRYPRRI